MGQRRKSTATGKAAAASRIVPPPFSDDALAVIFADKHEHYLRYHPGQRAWMRWTGSVWERDLGNTVINTVRLVCREAAGQCKSQAEAKRLTSMRQIASVEVLARSDPRFQTGARQWDSDRFLLNTPEGVIDLQTGKNSPHDPTFCITHITPVAPAGDCLVWHSFLH